MRFAALLAVLALAGAAGAAWPPACYTDHHALRLDAPQGTWYVTSDECDAPCLSLWVYEESNGIEGLQRGNDTIEDHQGGWSTELCPPDTVVF